MNKNRILLLIVVLLLSVTGYYYFKNSDSTIKKELRDFAVADTSSIDKMFLADKKGNKALLERKGPAL